MQNDGEVTALVDDVLEKGEGVMIDGRNIPLEEMIEEPVSGTLSTLNAAKKGLHTLFKEKDLLPINGVWFEIAEVQEEQMTLKPRNFTKNFAKRNN